MSSNSNANSTYYTEFQHGIIQSLDEITTKFGEATFEYKGINLRPAVEKKLYFKYLDDEDLKTKYAEKKSIRVEHLFPKKENRLVRLATHHLSRLKEWKSLVNEVSTNKVVLLYPSKKHKVFASKIFENENYEPINLTTIQSCYRPDLSKASEFLFRHHYDLLVFTESILKFLTRVKPSKLILIEGNKPEDSLCNEICEHLKIESFCIQHGWAFTTHLGFQNIGKTTFLSWGEHFSTELSILSNKTTFLNVGHPNLEQIELEPDDTKCISIFLQAPIRMIKQDTFESVIKLGIELGNSGLTILFREHPSWPLDSVYRKMINQAKNTELIDPFEVSLNQQLSRSRYGLTIFSSVGFECLAKGVMPVFLPINLHISIKPDLESNGLCKTFHSKESCLEYFNSGERHLNLDFNQFKRSLDLKFHEYFQTTGTESKNLIKSTIFGKK